MFSLLISLLSPLPTTMLRHDSKEYFCLLLIPNIQNSICHILDPQYLVVKRKEFFSLKSITSYHYFFFKNLFFKKFIFGCTGSLLLSGGFCWLQQAGALLVAVHRLFVSVASLIPEHRLQDTQAQQLWCAGLVVLWSVDFHGPENETVSPALAGAFLTNGPLGKSILVVFTKAAF